MPNELTLLQSCAAALAGSENATHLHEQKERIQQALERRDVSLVLDTSKAFLESLFKTVLTDRNGPVEDIDFQPLFRAVRDAMPFSDDVEVADYLHRVAGSIVHTIAELRNRYGAASHGDDGYYESPMRLSEAEMMVQFIDGLGAFVYQRHKETSDPQLAARIHYNDYPGFNDFLDTQFDGFHLALSDKHKLSITVSELLFQTDAKAYREMLMQYLSSEVEDGEPQSLEGNVE